MTVKKAIPKKEPLKKEPLKIKLIKMAKEDGSLADVHPEMVDHYKSGGFKTV
jgi:hypothetical protein